MSPEKSALPTPGNPVHRDHESPARRQWRKAGYATLFVFIVLVTVQTARLGIAGLFVQTAQFEIDQWVSKPSGQNPRDINRIARYFEGSLQFAADNPWALEGIGALNLTRMRASRVPREALAATRDSLVRFRRALIQRPTSPYLWANVALAKLYLSEIDGDFFAAMRHADELGPWEPAVQQTLLFVGLAAWQDLGFDLQQTLVRGIERGAMRNAHKMFEIVKSYRRFDLICAINNYRSIAGPDCGVSAPAAR